MPALVLEIAFDNVGRIRWDTPHREADRLDALEGTLRREEGGRRAPVQ
jgi:hypothetical protein